MAQEVDINDGNSMLQQSIYGFRRNLAALIDDDLLDVLNGQTLMTSIGTSDEQAISDFRK